VMNVVRSSLSAVLKQDENTAYHHQADHKKDLQKRVPPCDLVQPRTPIHWSRSRSIAKKSLIARPGEPVIRETIRIDSAAA
jgi:hypothetical protein